MNDKSDHGIRIGKGMSFAAWLIALGLLAVFFNQQLENQRNPNQNLATRIGADGIKEVSLTRNPAGHYLATGQINRQAAEFLLDTGATDVVVPAALATKLGLKRGQGVIYQTANGHVRGYRTRIESLKLGDIELNDVRAGINPAMHGEQVLLGMSALQQLELVQQGRQLRIRQY